MAEEENQLLFSDLGYTWHAHTHTCTCTAHKVEASLGHRAKTNDQNLQTFLGYFSSMNYYISIAARYFFWRKDNYGITTEMQRQGNVCPST